MFLQFLNNFEMYFNSLSKSNLIVQITPKVQLTGQNKVFTRRESLFKTLLTP